MLEKISETVAKDTASNLKSARFILPSFDIIRLDTRSSACPRSFMGKHLILGFRLKKKAEEDVKVDRGKGSG